MFNLHYVKVLAQIFYYVFSWYMNPICTVIGAASVRNTKPFHNALLRVLYSNIKILNTDRIIWWFEKFIVDNDVERLMSFFCYRIYICVDVWIKVLFGLKKNGNGEGNGFVWVTEINWRCKYIPIDIGHVVKPYAATRPSPPPLQYRPSV